MKKKKPNIHLVLIAVALALCIIGGIGAKLIVNDFGNVTVTTVSIPTQMGVLSGTLLVPDSATNDNKAPAIVVSHGATSNSESVDSWYMELARRGYVVLAPNMYEHGDSSLADEEYADTAEYDARGLIDDIEYIYTLPFVDTEKIAIIGHSLGGCCSMKTAKYYSDLEREALTNGATAEEAHSLNRVAACVTIGYPLEVKIDAMPSASSPDFEGYLCDLGVILGKCDDFQSWMNKDFLTNEYGPRWLETQTGIVVEEVKEGEFYESESNGYVFAAWNPNEIHNANMISTKTTGYIVDFFDEVFGAPNPIDSNAQTWGWKMFFNVVGMIGMFLFIIPCLYYVLKIPVFQTLERENTLVAVRKGTGLKYKENAEYFGFKTSWREFARTMGLAATVVGLTYGPILFTGSPTFGCDGSNLILLASAQSAIKLVSYFIPLGVTAFIHVKSQKYTGNIWTGALINALLIAMITIGNCSTAAAF